MNKEFNALHERLTGFYEEVDINHPGCTCFDSGHWAGSDINNPANDSEHLFNCHVYRLWMLRQVMTVENDSAELVQSITSLAKCHAASNCECDEDETWQILDWEDDTNIPEHSTDCPVYWAWRLQEMLNEKKPLRLPDKSAQEVFDAYANFNEEISLRLGQLQKSLTEWVEGDEFNRVMALLQNQKERPQ